MSAFSFKSFESGSSTGRLGHDAQRWHYMRFRSASGSSYNNKANLEVRRIMQIIYIVKSTHSLRRKAEPALNLRLKAMLSIPATIAYLEAIRVQDTFIQEVGWHCQASL